MRAAVERAQGSRERYRGNGQQVGCVVLVVLCVCGAANTYIIFKERRHYDTAMDTGYRKSRSQNGDLLVLNEAREEFTSGSVEAARARHDNAAWARQAPHRFGHERGG